MVNSGLMPSFGRDRQDYASVNTAASPKLPSNYSFDLANALSTRYSDSLPTEKDFTNMYQRLYFYNTAVTQLDAVRAKTNRPNLEKLDGIGNILANVSGYSNKQVTRMRKDPSIGELLDSISLSNDGPSLSKVVQKNPYVGLIDYRDMVKTYVANDPFNGKLEMLVSSNNQSLDSSQLLGTDISNNILAAVKKKDILVQLKKSPLQAQLYGLIDQSFSYNNQLKDSLKEAKKGYYGLVALKAGYDEQKIKQYLGKENSTTSVSRLFDRAGLDFKYMKELYFDGKNSAKSIVQPSQPVMNQQAANHSESIKQDKVNAKSEGSKVESTTTTIVNTDAIIINFEIEKAKMDAKKGVKKISKKKSRSNSDPFETALKLAA